MASASNWIIWVMVTTRTSVFVETDRSMHAPSVRKGVTGSRSSGVGSVFGWGDWKGTACRIRTTQGGRPNDYYCTR